MEHYELGMHCRAHLFYMVVASLLHNRSQLKDKAYVDTFAKRLAKETNKEWFTKSAGDADPSPVIADNPSYVQLPFCASDRVDLDWVIDMVMGHMPNLAAGRFRMLPWCLPPKL